MPSPPWFRFYSETLTDRKIDRVCRAACACKALVIGTWTTILALASDSPIRGVLLLTEDIPFTVEDLAGELGVELEMAQALVREFHRFNMINTDEAQTMYITNWNTRQFASDHSTDRVQRFRAKKKALQDEQGNGDETLQASYSNAPEQSRDRAETEQKKIQRQRQTTEGKRDDVAAACLQAVHDLGIEEPKASKLVKDGEADGILATLPTDLRAWIEHYRLQDGIKSPIGLAIRQVEARVEPPAGRVVGFLRDGPREQRF